MGDGHLLVRQETPARKSRCLPATSRGVGPSRAVSSGWRFKARRRGRSQAWTAVPVEKGARTAVTTGVSLAGVSGPRSDRPICPRALPRISREQQLMSSLCTETEPSRCALPDFLLRVDCAPVWPRQWVIALRAIGFRNDADVLVPW